VRRVVAWGPRAADGGLGRVPRAVVWGPRITEHQLRLNSRLALPGPSLPCPALDLAPYLALALARRLASATAGTGAECAAGVANEVNVQGVVDPEGELADEYAHSYPKMQMNMLIHLP
jgi:hypothetical protein